MINIRFEEREKIGLQYALETLHGCSPFGQEKIRKLRYYSPDEREELETELYNVEQAAKAADALKPLYDRIGLMLCQMKDIRGSLRRCQALEIPDHVELFEIKVYLQRLESLIPLFQQVCETTHFKALAFHDPAQALEILDPDKTRSRGFYIPDNATPKLREIRAAKKQIEEQLHHAQTDAEKEELRSRRTRVCAEEDSEETKVRRSMGQALAPLAGDLLEQKGRSFVPVSIRLEQGATVITGANMGGKSVVMKTVALNVLLLQAGFLVCAREARMPLFYSVKMLFDDLQSIQSGLSGFGSEIVQFQKALEEVEQGYSLFLLDEFARGTNPDEGAVIVQAVTKYLNEVNAISLLTTHYDKVAENARLHYQIIGLRDVDPEQIRQELAATGDDGIQVIARHMNYGLYRVEGKSDCPRDALNICRMLSLKPEILEKIEQAY